VPGVIRRARSALVVVLAALAASCGGTAGGAADRAAPPTETGGRPPATVPEPAPSTAVATTGPVTSTNPSSTTSVAPPSTSSTTTAPATTTTTVPPATAPATVAAPSDPAIGLGAASLAVDALQVLEIGRSREGRAIVAVERGTPGGVVVLVIGVIHGNEDDGVAIVEQLATAPVPPGVDLWLVESMNPDGQAAGRRGNAALVDLNRNFPHRWGPIGQPGDGQYAGTGPASEPETQAIVSFVSQIRPALGIWYHQDLYRLSPGEGFEGELKARYSAMTGLPILGITGGIYTGVAATWQRAAVEGISFIVELGATLSAEEARVHAAAVVELASAVASR
jgi:murein peptide amidase A